MKAVVPALTWILIATGVVGAAQPPQVEPPQSNPFPSSRELRSQLRQSHLAPLTNPTESGQSQKSLKELTEELRRLQLPQMQSVNPSPRTTTSSAKPAATQPSSDSSTTPTPTVERDKSKTPSQTQSQSGSTQQSTPAVDPILAVLAANPQAVVDLFSAAEALFAKRDLTRAAKLYQQVIAQRKDNLLDPNRSWILFQYANCLRISDSAQAARLYETVIADYPESDWAKVARARNSYFAWSQQARPDELLIRYGYDPNSF